jgi:hypothetical protein
VGRENSDPRARYGTQGVSPQAAEGAAEALPSEPVIRISPTVSLAPPGHLDSPAASLRGGCASFRRFRLAARFMGEPEAVSLVCGRSSHEMPTSAEFTDRNRGLRTTHRFRVRIRLVRIGPSRSAVGEWSARQRRVSRRSVAGGQTKAHQPVRRMKGASTTTH